MLTDTNLQRELGLGGIGVGEIRSLSSEALADAGAPDDLIALAQLLELYYGSGLKVSAAEYADGAAGDSNAPKKRVYSLSADELRNT